jgi:4-hydroxybenzoate polyprenyltransferase
MNLWFGEHLWITYLIIYVFVAFIYSKVFKTRRLPLLKELIVYLLIGVGTLILLIFQVDAGLPIIPSLAVAILLMLMVRIRYFVQGRRSRRKS